MFVHKERLEYVLQPADYAAPEVLEKETDRLFLRAWHPVALTNDLARDGDFLTLELLGRPLILRRAEGRLHAYLNVCSHRHCMLTELPRGNSPTLVCQYHGWEYRSCGKVDKVPDGGCFKPFDRDNAALRVFPVETCGELVFVRLSAEGDDLRTWLGQWHDRVAAAFAAPYKCNWRYATGFDCNWKIPVENTVETYHLPLVHPTTLGGFGLIPEEAQKHWLEDRSTTLVFDLGKDSEPVKKQRQVFPNLVFTFSDLFTYCQVYLPTSPTTSRTLAWMFSLDGTKRNLFARAIARLTARHGVKANAAIQAEDSSVFASQQKGIAASPFQGCIGTREERIWCFHDYLKRACS
jgi:choline monooxygenase